MEVVWDTPLFHAIERAAIKLAEIAGESDPYHAAKYHREDAKRVVLAAMGFEETRT